MTKNNKEFTPEMIETFKRLVSKGYTYYCHTNDGKAVISLERSEIGKTGKYSWSIHFLDYNNYGKNWVTTLDPREMIKDFYHAFKFERKLELAWKETLNKR